MQGVERDLLGQFMQVGFLLSIVAGLTTRSDEGFGGVAASGGGL